MHMPACYSVVDMSTPQRTLLLGCSFRLVSQRPVGIVPQPQRMVRIPFIEQAIAEPCHVLGATALSCGAPRKVVVRGDDTTADANNREAVVDKGGLILPRPVAARPWRAAIRER
jgi:hypothetical protein